MVNYEETVAIPLKKRWLTQLPYNPVIKCLINGVCKSKNKNYVTSDYKIICATLKLKELLHI